MKQTTTEWIIEQLDLNDDPMSMLKIIDQARQMEKEQAERMYSEEEVYELLLKHQSAYRSAVRNTSPLDWSFDVKQWFEQFKKK
jgi:hypothetical protein